MDEIARVLLQRMGDSSEFIQKAASQSLGIMVENVTPARAMTALMASGVQYVILLLVISFTLNCVGRGKGQEGEGTGDRRGMMGGKGPFSCIFCELGDEILRSTSLPSSCHLLLPYYSLFVLTICQRSLERRRGE